MNNEQIITLISLISNVIITLIVNISSIISLYLNTSNQNLEEKFKFNKEITKYELEFKDLNWFNSVLRNELKTYNKRSQKRIYKYYKRKVARNND